MQDEDTDAVLVFAPFRKYPKLIFDSDKEEISKLLHIMGRNLNNSTTKVQLERFPPVEHHLTYSAIKSGTEHRKKTD
jgi:hypothetical protein